MTRLAGRPGFVLGSILLLFITSGLPAHACSVCFSETSPLARYAYYGTTIGLILLPAGLVTAFAIWIRSAESASDGAPLREQR